MGKSIGGKILTGIILAAIYNTGNYWREKFDGFCNFPCQNCNCAV